MNLGREAVVKKYLFSLIIRPKAEFFKYLFNFEGKPPTRKYVRYLTQSLLAGISPTLRTTCFMWKGKSGGGGGFFNNIDMFNKSAKEFCTAQTQNTFGR